MPIIRRLYTLALFFLAAGSVIAAKPLAPTPPMGWNSWDSYVAHIHETQCHENLETFVEVFKPLGYTYFVIDAGWYREYQRDPETLQPRQPIVGGEVDVRLDPYGRLLPSRSSFPSDLKALAEACHRHGVKFGVHVMRGIPRKAYALNTPVEGTPYTARDIADPSSICHWSQLCYGIDMSKPGAQASFDGWIRPYGFQHVWNEKSFAPGFIELEPNGCLFLRYELKS